MYKRLRNWFYLGCMAILIATFARFNYVKTVTSSNTVEIQDSSTVDRGDIVLTVSATGSIQALQEVPLAFAALGKVDTLNVKVGDHVLRGQTLASLDTQAQQTALKNTQFALDLQRIAYNALAAAPRDVDLKAAQAALAAAQAQLSAARIGYDPTQVKIASLQVELAKNLAWQSQLSRDQSVARANQPDPLASLYADVWRLPPQARDQALKVLGLLSAPSSLSSSLLPSPQDAEAGVRKTGYEVQIAQAQLDQAKSQGANLGSVAAAQLAVTSAQVALDKLQEGAKPENIAVAQAQIDAAQAAVDLASYSLSHATLTAPFDGVVAEINLVPGEPTPTDKPAILLIDNSQFYVDIPVDEADISKVAPGQTVDLTLGSLRGETIEGHVSRIADTALNVGDVVSYLVRVNIDSTGHALRSGMSTTAVITVNQIKDAIRVRNRFVRLDRKSGRATTVIQLSNGSVKEIELKLGLRNDTYSEIKSGLSVGDTVVLLPRQVNLFK